MPPVAFDVFRRALKKGEIGPAYYLHGSEDLLKDDALRELLDTALDPATRDFNLDRRRAAEVTADEFLSLALTPPMMAARRAVILTDADDLQQRRPRLQGLRAAILEYALKPSPETLLVLVQPAGARPDADMVRALSAVEFAPLPPPRLARWIRHRAESEGLRLDEEGALLLHEAVGDDLGQLASEIAKLRGAAGAGEASAADVAALVGIRRGETLHDLVDAVAARRFHDAVDMVRRLLDAPGNSGVRIVSSLATALVGLALARALLDRGSSAASAARELENAIRAARPMGLRTWRLEAAGWVENARGWTAAEIEAALSGLLKADRRLKATSLGGEAGVLCDALLAIAGAARTTA